jgi:hypothetical protein
VPANRSCTYCLSLSLVASLATLADAPDGSRATALSWPGNSNEHCGGRSWRYGAVPGRSLRGHGLPAGQSLTHPGTLRPQDGDLLPLNERQVLAQRRSLSDRRHAATLTKPSRTHPWRHAARHGSIAGRQPVSYGLPEPLSNFTPPPGPTRRPQRRPPRHLSQPQTSHHNSSPSRCCDDRLNPPCRRGPAAAGRHAATSCPPPRALSCTES